MTRLLRPLVSPETYRALLYYVVSLGLGVVAFTLLIAGWVATLVFAITPLAVPLLIGLRAAVGQLARAEASVARDLLGTDTRPPTSTPGEGFWSRGFNVLKDGAFWRQQAHLLLAWPIALIPLALLSVAFQMITLPVWYRWADSGDVFGFSNIDTFAETLPLLGIGLGVLVVVAYVVGPLARLSRRLVSGLLAGQGEGVVRSPAETRARRIRLLLIHTELTFAVSFVLVAIWALTTRDYFWPVWPLLSLGLVLGIHAWVVAVNVNTDIPRIAAGSRWLAVEVGVAGLISAFFVGVWAASTHGYFWPIWPIVGFTAFLIGHAGFLLFWREHGRLHRIETLETSRAGAVDVQETELRRIERDLHDGAQARLVAVGISLGMAEQKLETEPEAVRELLAEARRGAGEALDELRDLARGIHPPILTDRGLEAAVAALTARSPVPVALSVDVSGRPPAAVETAAYFTVSEALANVIKHAEARRVEIRIEKADGLLVAEVVDDGEGGADTSGRGLTGLRQRVEALDGRLRVTSPAGGPTTVRAELPCAS
jgi:signal transduction histidine kinase